jgi:hypothetical protein
MPESIDPRKPYRRAGQIGTPTSGHWNDAKRQWADVMPEEQCWQELTRALRAIRSPHQRASSCARVAAQAVARELRSAGAPASSIRQALTELVTQLHGTAQLGSGTFHPSGRSVLLADVLQAAVGDTDSLEPIQLMDERRAG